MKTNKTYNKRLSTFAEHLKKIKTHPEMGLFETVELVALEERVRIHYNVTYPSWVFGELPIVFDEWYYAEKFGEPLCKGVDEKDGTVAAVIDFFGLSLDEFGHLFDSEGFQLIGRFGGVKLTKGSSATDIAYNISCLVRRREPGLADDYFV